MRITKITAIRDVRKLFNENGDFSVADAKSVVDTAEHDGTVTFMGVKITSHGDGQFTVKVPKGTRELTVYDYVLDCTSFTREGAVEAYSKHEAVVMLAREYWFPADTTVKLSKCRRPQFHESILGREQNNLRNA